MIKVRQVFTLEHWGMGMPHTFVIKQIDDDTVTYGYGDRVSVEKNSITMVRTEFERLSCMTEEDFLREKKSKITLR